MYFIVSLAQPGACNNVRHLYKSSTLVHQWLLFFYTWGWSENIIWAFRATSRSARLYLGIGVPFPENGSFDAG